MRQNSISSKEVNNAKIAFKNIKNYSSSPDRRKNDRDNPSANCESTGLFTSNVSRAGELKKNGALQPSISENQKTHALIEKYYKEMSKA